MRGASAGAQRRAPGWRIMIAAGAAVLAASLGSALPAAAADEQLPDLQMSEPYNLRLEHGRGGGVRLRFGTIVWNVGDGPLEIHASEREGRTMSNLVQRISTRAGGIVAHTPPGASAFYSGDGHDHWHINTFVVVSMFSKSADPVPPNLSPTFTQRSLRKIGFCLTDLVRAPAALRPANASARIRYPVSGCGTRQSESLRIGISPGWGDDYKPFFNQQLIDISGLPEGTYRMCATVNGSGVWREKNDNYDNNASWVDLELAAKGRSFRILDTGEFDCERPEPVWYGVGA